MNAPTRLRPAALVPRRAALAALFSGLLLAAAAPPVPAAAADDRWIHVSVDGTAEEPERVRVNLPLTLLTALEPVLRSHCGDHDSIFRVDGRELRRRDLVAILKAVKESKDGEFVTIEDASDTVRVSKRKNVIFVRVTEDADARESKGGAKEAAASNVVDLQLPIRVVEALVAGTGDELDFGAALRALAASDAGELVSVHDDGERIRIWIDDKNTSD